MNHDDNRLYGVLASGSMRFKVIIIILLLLVVSIIVTLNLFFYQSHEAEMASQINVQQTILVRSIVLSVDSTMKHMKEEAISLAGLLSVRGLKKQGLYNFMQYAFEELNEDIKIDIVIFDAHGSVILSTQKNYFKSDEDSELFKSSILLPPSQVNMLTSGQGLLNLKMATPIRRGSDIIGSIMMIISIDDFNKKFLEPLRAGERGHAWVMDEEGTLIYHPTMPEMVGRSITTDDEECFNCHSSFNAERQILESPDIGYSSYVAPYGEDKLLAFARASQVGWIVCVTIPYSEVTASMKNSMRLQSLLVITIFISTLAVAFIMILINRQRLRAESKAIYADKLKDYASALEEIVNERTKELKSEKEKLDAVIGTISAGICIFDDEGLCTWMNKVMQNWLGSDSRDNVKISDVYDPADPASEVYEAVVRDGHIQETRTLTFGEKTGTFQMTLSPFHMPDGSTQRLLLLQDITELKMAEEQMVQSDKLTALSRLSAGVSHEIGNPLTSISSYVQILMDMKFDDFAGEALDTISKHVKRIETILRKMSAFSRSKDDDVRMHNVGELVSSTVDLVKYDRRTMNINISLNIPEDIPYVNVNGGQIIQIITNLVLNAADAMGEGGELLISAEHFLIDNSSDEVHILFADSGPGIDAVNLKRVFDPFFTTKATGTGLGLAVSHSIAKSFGGNITVSSEVGKGTTFIVRLPAHER